VILATQFGIVRGDDPQLHRQTPRLDLSPYSSSHRLYKPAHRAAELALTSLIPDNASRELLIGKTKSLTATIDLI